MQIDRFFSFFLRKDMEQLNAYQPPVKASEFRTLLMDCKGSFKRYFVSSNAWEDSEQTEFVSTKNTNVKIETIPLKRKSDFCTKNYKLIVCTAYITNHFSMTYLILVAYLQSNENVELMIYEYSGKKNDSLYKNGKESAKVLSIHVVNLPQLPGDVEVHLLEDPYILLPCQQGNISKETKRETLNQCSGISLYSFGKKRETTTNGTKRAFTNVQISQFNATQFSLAVNLTHDHFRNRYNIDDVTFSYDKRKKLRTQDSGGRSNLLYLSNSGDFDPKISNPDYHLSSLLKTGKPTVVAPVDLVAALKAMPEEMIGPIAMQLFSSTGWKLGEYPKVSEFKYTNSTIDVDQMTMETKFIGSNVATFINENHILSNGEYLTMVSNLLKNNVFTVNGNVELPPGKVEFDKQAFATLQSKQGGSTYMSSKVRNKYHLIYQKVEQDVLKLSYRVEPQSVYTKTMPTLWCGENEYFNSKWLTQDESKILDGYCDTSASNTDRMWIAAQLVAFWLNRMSPSIQNHYQALQVLYGVAQPQRVISAVGGEYFYFLVLFQFILLDCCLKHSAVSICLETYGGKSRSFSSIDIENYDESILRVVQEMTSANIRLSTNTIFLFHTLLKNVFDFKDQNTKNILTCGVGLTFNVSRRSDDQKLFAAVENPYTFATPKSRSSSDNHYSTRGSGTNSKETLNENIFETVIDNEDDSDFGLTDDEGYKPINHYQDDVSLSFREVLKKYGSKRIVNYWPGSGLLPLNLNPYTARVQVPSSNMFTLTRMQHYHVAFREAFGEKGIKQKLSELAGCFFARSYVSENGQILSLPLTKVLDDYNNFNTNFSLTLEAIKEVGNGARLELAFHCELERNSTFNSVLRGLVPIVVRVVRDLTSAYDVSCIVDMLKIFSMALKHKMENLVQTICSKQFHSSISEFDVLQIIQEVMFNYHI